jgi:glutaredoxin
MTTITLYTKENCSLCDIVEETLASLHALYPHELVKVDITADHDLYLKYRYTIPVITLGQTTLHAPITALQLANLLRAESKVPSPQSKNG